MPAFSDVQYASVNAAPGLGVDATIVAAVAGKRIRVLNYCITTSGAGIVTIKSGAATTIAVSDQSSAGKPVPINSSGFNGLFETARGEALVMNPSTAITITGHLAYVLI